MAVSYRRAILSRRAVRVKSQLISHKRFANAFLTYCHLVDNARLYCTNALEGPPKVSRIPFFLVLPRLVITRLLVALNSIIQFRVINLNSGYEQGCVQIWWVF